MSHDICLQIIAKAYEVDPTGLDGIAHVLGHPDWSSAVKSLKFIEVSTGGGFSMAVAHFTTTSECRVLITNGEAELPKTVNHFWLSVVNEQDEDLLTISI